MKRQFLIDFMRRVVMTYPRVIKDNFVSWKRSNEFGEMELRATLIADDTGRLVIHSLELVSMVNYGEGIFQELVLEVSRHGSSEIQHEVRTTEHYPDMAVEFNGQFIRALRHGITKCWVDIALLRERGMGWNLLVESICRPDDTVDDLMYDIGLMTLIAHGD